MSKWTIEVHLVCVFNERPRRIIVLDESEDADMVLKLVQVGARFAYEGYRYVGERPTVNPIERKLIYYCEGYPE